MNCREFLIEFEERGNLTETARLHLTVCTDCKKTSERQAQIWLLIEDLQPIAAPSDFDFHVKAKIANAKPSDFQKPAFIPILRYVLPLSVSVLLLGVFVFNSGYFSDAPANSDFAQTQPTMQNALPFNVSTNNQLAFAPPSDNSKPEAVAANFEEKPVMATNSARTTANNRKPRIEPLDLRVNEEPTAKSKDEEGIGSRLLSGTSANSLFPKGLNPNANTAAAAPNFEPPRSPDEKNTFSIIGIEFRLENGKRVVKSLQSNSMAERSGVKIGDVIERMNGSNLTILRGTDKIEITLR